jgi:hypothetical protein
MKDFFSFFITLLVSSLMLSLQLIEIPSMVLG